jgi:catechol 2,3-dioxygenase-like lactoylglutathione lyase family enzyme
MPDLRGVLETSLYVADLERSRLFYTHLFGFPVLVQDSRFCALDVGGRQILLLFRTAATTTPMETPRGVIPSHGGTGQLHVAFAMDKGELKAWEQRLIDDHIPIESRLTWPRGGISLYFRDPDGHLLELVTPGVWATY